MDPATHTHSTLRCRRCRTDVVIPQSVSAETLDLVAKSKGDVIRQMAALRLDQRLTLKECKILAQHVTIDATCHECKAAIPLALTSECECWAVNLNLTLPPRTPDEP